VAGVRLGVLGGTLDPVHRVHLLLAAAARDELGLERVLFVPAGQPWRKAARPITSAEHRLAMLRLALEGEGAFEIATLELEREGPSYAADTLEALRRDQPKDELFFILGEDALVDLPNWVRPRRILELATLAVAKRGGTDREEVEEAARRLPGLLDRVAWLKMPLVEVSATEIRDRVRRGLPIGDLVPAVVEAYIREHGLYQA
jgi:nicotinate-nucleotide adenylyltransferase